MTTTRVNDQIEVTWLGHRTSSESFAPLNVWALAVKVDLSESYKYASEEMRAKIAKHLADSIFGEPVDTTIDHAVKVTS